MNIRLSIGKKLREKQGGEQGGPVGGIIELECLSNVTDCFLKGGNFNGYLARICPCRWRSN